MRNSIKYKLLTRLLFLCCCSLLFSCSEDHYDFPGDSGKVFVRLQSATMVNSVSNLVDGKISKTILGTMGEVEISFPVRTTMPVSGSLTASFEIDNALIDDFNAQHQTSYVAIGLDKLLFEKQTVTIEDGRMESTDLVIVRINPEKIADLELGEYLVPIKLASVSGSMGISSNWNVVYLHVSVVSDATGIPCADRTGWTVADVSSSIDPSYEYGNGAPENVLDGDNYTYWQTEWAPLEVEPPHYITIDMGEVQSLAGIQYVTRNHNMDWPQTMFVEVSTDAISWEKVAEYTDLPQGGNVEFRTLFDAVVDARYFRLIITKMYGGRVFTALAEVNAFVLMN